MSGVRATVAKVELSPIGWEVTAELAPDDLVTAEHYAPPGVDAPPLPGDEVVVEEAEGTGEVTACKYEDQKNVSKAAPGEHRTYARDAEGVITAEIWSRANGDVEIVSVKAGGKVKINGVEIDQQGNITTPGEVTAKADTVPIPLSTHLHPTAMGPSGPPQAPPGP